MKFDDSSDKKHSRFLNKLVIGIIVFFFISVSFSSICSADNINIIIFFEELDRTVSEGESLYVGETHLITWYINGDVGSSLDIYLCSKDENIVSIIDENVESSLDEYSWEIPASTKTNRYYKIKVSSSSNENVFDYSTYFFLNDPRYIEVTSPDTFDTWYKKRIFNITWTSVNVGGRDVKIELNNYGRDPMVIDARTQNNGWYKWYIPESIDVDNDYKIKISSVSYPHIYDESKSFTIDEITKSIQVKTPSKDSILIVNDTGIIKWDSEWIEGLINITLYENGFFKRTIVNDTEDDGLYKWTIDSDLESGSLYEIKISSELDNITSSSDQFTIQKRFINVISDFSEIDLEDTSEVSIQWTSCCAGLYVTIDLYQNHNFEGRIASPVDNDGEYTWEIPEDTYDGENYSIKVSSNLYDSVYSSSSLFLITQPSMSLLPFLYLFIAILGIVLLIKLLSKNKSKRKNKLKTGLQEKESIQTKKQSVEKKKEDDRYEYWYEKALKQKKNKKYDEALKSLQRSLTINPDYKKAQVETTFINSLIQGQKEINKLTEEAHAFFKEKKFLEAFEVYEKILRRDKQNRHAKEKGEESFQKLLTQIRSLKRKKAFTQALDLVNSVKAKRPNNLKLQQLQKNIKRNINKQKTPTVPPKKPEKKKESVETHDETYWFEEALKAKKEKNYAKALSFLNEALSINEFYSEAINEKNEIKSIILFEKELDKKIQQADKEFNNEEYKKALQSYNEVLDDDKKNSYVQSKKKEILNILKKQMNDFEKEKKYSKSLELITILLKEKPENKTLLDHKKKLKIKINEPDEHYWYNEAIKQKEKKQYDKALTYLDKALSIKKTFSKAQQEKNKIITIITNDQIITNLLEEANTFFINKEYSKAVEFYNKILAINPNHATALGKKKIALNQDYHLSANEVVQLGNEKKRENIPKLITYTNSENGNNRKLAASALGKLHSLTPEIFSAVPSLIKLTKDKKPQVRQYAIKALGKIGDKRAIHQLEKIKNNDEKEYNRDAAKIAIEKINRSLTSDQISKRNSVKGGESMENLCDTCKLRNECKERSDHRIVGCSNYVKLSSSDSNKETPKENNIHQFTDKQWYYKALIQKQKKNYKKAIECLDNAISLNGDFYEALFLRKKIVSILNSKIEPELKKEIRPEKEENFNWTEEIKRIVLYEISSDQFNLKDMYDYESKLKENFPQNDHVKDKIRQQLQVLRDRGVIVFLGGGNYSVASRYSKHRRLLEKKLKKETKSKEWGSSGKNLVRKSTPWYKEDLNELLKFPGIGRGAIVSLKIAGYDNLDKVAALNLNEISKIDGIGPEKAKNILRAIKKVIDQKDIDTKVISSKNEKIRKKSKTSQTQKATIDNTEIDSILKNLNEKLAQNPDDENALLMKGMLLLQHHHYKKSLKSFHHLTQLNQNNEKAWYSKGLAYKHLKKYKKALLCFDIILQANPSNKEAVKQRDEILKYINGNKQ